MQVPRESEVLTSAIVDAAKDAIIAVDEEGTIVLFNNAATKIFGYAADEVLGRSLSMLIPERFRDVHVGHLKRFAVNGLSPRSMTGDRIVMALRRTGEEFPIDATISMVDTPGGRRLIVVHRDISRQTETDAALDAARQEVQRLSRGVTVAREEEKRHLARELHDEVAQDLAVLKIWVKGMQTTLTSRATLLRTLQGRLDLLRESHMARGLELSSAEKAELAATIESLLAQFAQRLGVKHDVTLPLLATDRRGAQSTTGYLFVLAVLRIEVRGIIEQVSTEVTALGSVAEQIDNLLVAVRRIANALRPLILDDLGLGPAIETLLRQLHERSEVRYTLAVDPRDLELREPYATAIYRITQEALTNVVKHARARTVAVHLQLIAESVSLEVTDDGRGFSMASGRSAKSFGLASMSERATVLGGTLDIDTAPGKGTTIHVSIPYGRSDSDPPAG